MVVVTPKVEPVEMAIAPARELPIETAPVEVPVLMLVSKFDEALRDTVPPVIVRPVAPVTNPVEVKASSVLSVSDAERYSVTPFASVPNWMPEATVEDVQVPSQSKQRP